MNRSHYLVLVAATLLFISAWSTPEDLNLEQLSAALVTDAVIDRTSLDFARTEITVQGVEEGSVPDGAQVELPDFEGQPSNQAALLDVGGYIAHVRIVKGSSTTWQQG